MANSGIIFGLLLILTGAGPVFAAQDAGERWTAKEMGETGRRRRARRSSCGCCRRVRTFPAQFQLRRDRLAACEFQLTYFLGDGFDLAKKQRLNILYIPGGPGAIVDPSNRSAALRLLERKHNVVYFHPRGAAQSAIDGDKEYDRFLRADYVVEDIEKLRQASSQVPSVGCHLRAQLGHGDRAALRGQVRQPEGSGTEGEEPDSIRAGGPASSRTHAARTQMTVDNLRKIFAYYRSQGAANCRCESSSYLRPLVTDFSDPQISTERCWPAWSER